MIPGATILAITAGCGPPIIRPGIMAAHLWLPHFCIIQDMHTTIRIITGTTEATDTMAGMDTTAAGGMRARAAMEQGTRATREEEMQAVYTGIQAGNRTSEIQARMFPPREAVTLCRQGQDLRQRGTPQVRLSEAADQAR